MKEAHLSSPCSPYNSDSTLFQDFAQLQSTLCSHPAHHSLFRSQALGILKKLYLPHGDHTEKFDLVSISCFSWPHAICQLQSRSKVLDESLFAFCAIQISLHEQRTVSEDAAFQLYDKALSSLVEHLEFPHEQSKDETLAAIVVLSTCEVGDSLAHQRADSLTKFLLAIYIRQRRRLESSCPWHIGALASSSRFQEQFYSLAASLFSASTHLRKFSD